MRKTRLKGKKGGKEGMKEKINSNTKVGESMRKKKGARKQKTTVILKHSMKKGEDYLSLGGRQKYGRKGEEPGSISEFLPKTALN